MVKMWRVKYRRNLQEMCAMARVGGAVKWHGCKSEFFLGGSNGIGQHDNAEGHEMDTNTEKK